tara:strand:- start:957 stop:2420 length:1464 start_codon:yes stop_codon:yes gene_type:complete
MSRRNPRDSAVHFRTRVHKVITRHDLIQTGDRIVLGVSGGPDSTCLAAILHEWIKKWNLTLYLAHVNYGIRGHEAKEDEMFVKRLAQKLDLKVSIKHVTSDDLASLERESFQARARTVRYRFFEHVAQQQGAQKIATGHTADDQAETVLMWAIRGAGLTGLGGIPIQRCQKIIRPLITLTRTDVLAYLDARHLTFQTDSSNEVPVYLRNRIRHEVIPTLQTYNPKIGRALSQLAEIVSEDEKILSTITRQIFQDILVPNQDTKETDSLHISRSRFLNLPRGFQRRCIRQAVDHINGDTRRLTFVHIEEAIVCITVSSRPSASYECAGVIVNHHCHDVIAITKTNTQLQPLYWDAQYLSVPAEIELHVLGCRIKTWSESSLAGDFPVSHATFRAHNSMIAHFDSDTFGLPLTVRSWKDGDVFCPSGMDGKKKKLQDYFVDTKIPKRLRSQIPLIVASEGILWVSGYRQDDRFRCRSTTRRTCTIQVIR